MKTRIGSPRKIRVLCVDDSEDIAQLLSRCIAAESDMESAGSLHAADDLLAEVERVRPHVVILDMTMPGKDPLVALRELLAVAAAAGDGAVERVHVIAYSGHDDQHSVDRARDAGARGYISKDAEVPVVLQAIREVARGNIAFRAWL